MTLYQRINEKEGLANLLRQFYADVRQHDVLGPIFNSRIHDWPAHLAKIQEFWALQTGGPSSYRGGMMVHTILPLKPEHFSFWLALWDFNCRRNLPVAEARELSDKAHQIGQHLQRMVFEKNGLLPG